MRLPPVSDERQWQDAGGSSSHTGRTGYSRLPLRDLLQWAIGGVEVCPALFQECARYLIDKRGINLSARLGQTQGAKAYFVYRRCPFGCSSFPIL